MKKLFTRALMLIAAVCMAGGMAKAQNMPLPVDQEVRVGQLPNGMTYYIRHNEKPKGQADFYIAQKVGSILEEDSQRGLAHFLEHMCFNGTTHFPGKDIINWLETVGVKFGRNLNAYTSIDETVYNISNVPVARESVQDSCLLILHDWANDLLLEDAEIDAERAVIHEEWRRSNAGQMRILTDILPTVMSDTRYGYRLPIGTMEVVDNFPYQELRDYYERWYRPDQQGIIVVGDIDVDRIENKIKEMFADIEMPADAPARTYLPVPDNEGTIYAIGSDPEMEHAVVSMMFKTDNIPFEERNTLAYLVQDYIMDMIANMLDARYDELAAKPEATFANAGASYGEFFVAKTKDAFDIQGVSKTDDIRPIVGDIYRELLRARNNGFTQSEYDRAREEYMSQLEKAYTGRNDRQNVTYVSQYKNNFLDGNPMMSIEDKYQLMQQLAPNIPLEAINSILPQLITDDNRVVMALLPQKEGLTDPTADELAAIIAAVDAEEIEAFVDSMKEEPLIPALPAPGAIVRESHNDRWDATELVLSNGVKVIVKPTKFKEDEILFTAEAKGGHSVYDNSYDAEFKTFDALNGDNGLGDYTATDLTKYLSGKQAYCRLSIDEFDRTIAGSSTPKDLPTLMELIYMNFTGYSFAPEEFAAKQQSEASALRNQENSPQFVFFRDLLQNLFPNSRRHSVTPDEILAADRDKMLQAVHTMTANAADYDFIFVGNIDMDVLKPLLEQYIATLPADAATANHDWHLDPTYEVVDGTQVLGSTTQMATPQTWTMIVAAADLPYSSKNAKLASVAGQVLSKRLLDKVREEMGAVYSISASGAMSRIPGKNTMIQSAFPMKPEMKQQVLDYIVGEMNNMKSDVKPEEVAKAIEYMVKEYNENLEKNQAWLSAISGYNNNGVDTFNGSLDVLQSITPADVQQFMTDLLNAENIITFTLDPAE